MVLQSNTLMHEQMKHNPPHTPRWKTPLLEHIGSICVPWGKDLTPGIGSADPTLLARLQGLSPWAHTGWCCCPRCHCQAVLGAWLLAGWVPASWGPRDGSLPSLPGPASSLHLADVTPKTHSTQTLPQGAQHEASRSAAVNM